MALFAGALVMAVVFAAIAGAVTLALHLVGSATGNGVFVRGFAASQSAAGDSAGSVEQVAAKVVTSVAMLRTVMDNHYELGSGVVLSSDGLVLTNRHVVAVSNKGADGRPDTLVTFNDGRAAPFTVVGADPVSDIAIVRAQGVSRLTPITWGSSANLRVGQQVVAVGSPLGYEGTVTNGIISALRRPVSWYEGTNDERTVLDVIQTDAAINPGNSGGALANMNGELIGVNSATAMPGGELTSAQSGSNGLGFAIPVDQVKRIADELITTGKASHASLGVDVIDGDIRGAMVAELTSGGPAAQAGLATNVVINRIDDQMIDSADALIAVVASKAPGEKVTLSYIDTSGSTKTTQVTLGTVRDQG
ncbi:S1C family serine protease [Mycobacterium sp. 852002-51057_SCH5723018]|uniref:S1C family serine protease n=1 Tax=Mycobacterium sp. 852002-51057_SCH5723018 TaxID=1834094 RepID=UPI0007FFCA92|nr:trypsin-like peptidase domain-containing protein [Mycobacterium sp. 852002-51057_SCH5723018]OBG28531.1 serine protease [Mycobacterium sp. 852002-51057_SCH5723018]